MPQRYFSDKHPMEKSAYLHRVRTLCHALSMTTISKLIFFIGDY